MRVTLYSKPGCCLCEDLTALLQDLIDEFSIELQECNIEEDADALGRRSLALDQTPQGGQGARGPLWGRQRVPPPFWASRLRKKTGSVVRSDRWQIIHFEAPCTVTIDVGVAPAGTGAPQGDRSKGVHNPFLARALLGANINELRARYVLPAPPAAVSALVEQSLQAAAVRQPNFITTRHVSGE